MSLYTQFQTSKALEENGINVKFKANDDGTIPTFKIGRACRSNIKWQKTVEAKTRPFKEEIDSKTISEETSQEIFLDIYISSLLYGWENVKDENEKNLEFNRENAFKLFKDLPELYDVLNAKSSEMSNFLAANLKADAKN